MFKVELLAQERARRSLAEFTKQAWEVIEPGTPLVWNWHMQTLCDHVQAWYEGRLPKNNLKVAVPPGTSKTTIICVMLPAWIWANDPTQRGIFGSTSQNNTTQSSLKCRDILRSEWYEGHRMGWTMTQDQDSKNLFKTTEAGFRLALTCGSRITGGRGDIIVIDDPNDVVDAQSEPKRNAVNYWWDNAAANRLNSLVDGRRLVLQQRVHEDDLSGHIEATDEDNWCSLVIRQVMEAEDIGKPFPDGTVDPRQNEGDLLDPIRFPQSAIDGEKRRLGSYGFAAQHQQRPAPAEGGMFKRQWFRSYTRLGDAIQHNGKLYPLADMTRFVTADTATTAKEKADHTAIASWALFNGSESDPKKLFLLNMERAQMEAPDVRAMLLDMWKSGQYSHLAVEKAHAGTAICQDLQRLGVLLKELKPVKDKVTRAQQAIVAAEAGQLILPADAPWLADLMHELLQFPAGKHDDQVDAIAWGAIEAFSGIEWTF